MANDNKQNPLMRKLPDIVPVRKGVSALKIKMTKKHSISDIEVYAGEECWAEKEKIVEKYKSKWPAAFKYIENLINISFSEIPIYIEMQKAPDKVMELEKIKTDMIFCYFAYGFTANEYFVFHLKDKEVKERKNFISSRLHMIFRCQMNDLLKADIFNDKTKTYAYFKKYYHREAIAISTPADFAEFQNYVKKHPIFVKKQCFEAQGHSVELVDIRKSGKTEKELFDSLIKAGKHILEEKIIQSPAMAIFNESSVNTVRSITFNTRQGIVVPYCTIRTGRPGAFVDNGGAGGIQACINYENGKIISDGFDEIGGKYVNHPASNTTFKGYQLPDWRQLQSLVKETASKMPLIKFIGWDLAHTKDGWVIVEGNENCYVIAQQMIMDQGMRDIFEKIMKDMDLII